LKALRVWRMGSGFGVAPPRRSVAERRSGRSVRSTTSVISVRGESSRPERLMALTHAVDHELTADAHLHGVAGGDGAHLLEVQHRDVRVERVLRIGRRE